MDAKPTGRSRPGRAGGTRENFLNRRIAELLKSLLPRDVIVDFEHTQEGSSRTIDIVVTLDSHVVIAVEAEINSRRGSLADAQARLDQNEAGEVNVQEAIALNYPAGTEESSLDKSTRIEWAVLPSDNFTEGTPRDLAAVIARVPEMRGDPDAIAAKIDRALTLASGMLSKGQKVDLARALDLPTTQKINGHTVDRTSAATRRGLLVIAAAAMFHARLDPHLLDLEPGKVAHRGLLGRPKGVPDHESWPPARIGDCIRADNPIEALLDAWGAIRIVDYDRIFESACDALKAPADNEGWRRAIRKTAAAGRDAAADEASRSHDLIGRIFHRLLDSARYDGSFYTSTSAATMLAGLAIRERDIPKDLSTYKLIDPACGTGTLLMASADRIRDLRSPKQAKSDAVTIVEETIWGLDVNITACHMAATTLGLLSPSTTFKHMNIHKYELGSTDTTGTADQGGAQSVDTRAGSLELLASRTERNGNQERLSVGWSAGKQVDTEMQVEPDPNLFDLVIMNPPYTRDSLRHQQLSTTERRLLKSREKSLARNRSADATAIGTMFIDLGEHLTKLDDGATLAFVFPLAGSAAPSASGIRKLLAEWFHIEWVIASHDIKRTCFSENTDISEMLVVARRHSESHPAQRPPTKFAILRNNSRSVAKATTTVAALRTDSLDASDGSITEWPAEDMTAGNWRPLGITSEFLVEVSQKIKSGDLFSVELFGELAHIEPHGRRVYDAFKPDIAPDQHGRRALWTNETDVVQSLEVSADKYILTKPGKEEAADRYWSMRSNLLVCRFPRLNTLRVASVWSPEPILASNWIPVRAKSIVTADHQVWYKAMCVWLNSTLGIVNIVASASPRILSRPDLNLKPCREMRVPVFDSVQAAALADAFDIYRHANPKTLSGITADSVRQALDNAVQPVLDLSPEMLSTARFELMQEPSVQ